MTKDASESRPFTFQKHELSEFANLDELYYRDKIQPSEEKYNSIDKEEALVRGDKRLSILPRLESLGISPSGEGVDLGAGSGWLTAQLSALTSVNRVHAVEYSEWQLEQVAPSIIERLGGISDKVVLHRGDMHRLNMFGNKSLDFVAASAVLHHATDLGEVLRECHRVLHRDGLMLAICEPGIPRIVTPLTRGLSAEKFGAEERQHGVREQTLFESEWRQAFEAANFRVRFIPMFVRSVTWRAQVVRSSPLRWTNGLLFWDKAIVAYSE